MPRFIPVSSMGQPAPQSAPDTEGFGATDAFGLARTGLNAARFGVSGLESLGATMPSYLGPAFGGIGGILGLGMGASQLAEGNVLGGSLGVLGGLAGTASAAGTLGAGGALGSTMAAAAPALSAVGSIAAPILAVAAIAGMNAMHKEQKRIQNQTGESVRMRQGAQRGLRMLSGGQDAAQAGSRDLDAFRNPLAGHHVVQQAIGARGQGGPFSLTRPLDEATLAQWTQAYYPMLRDTQIGYVNAADAAARGGQALPDWMTQAFGTYDPAALLHSQAAGMYGNQPTPGVNAYWGTDYSQAVPGTLGQFLPAQLGPGQITDRYAQMPALPGGQALTPEQIAQAAQQRQQAAQQQFQTAMQASGGTPQGLLNPAVAGGNLAYAAPYMAGGSEQMWRNLGLPEDLIDLGRAGMTDLPSALATLQGRLDSGEEVRRSSIGGGDGAGGDGTGGDF